ncbi:MAG: hypothetical protein M3275_02490 [Thermoproteota archaeon]|nr:hypothetical protein [Thermoproteota archaeon]
MPRRREALLDIRRLIVDEGLSHNEIQLQLNLSPSTYFRYLDILFKAEQEAISGNAYTYQRLLNETLILNQRYLRRAKKLTTTIGDNENVDAEQRIEAHRMAAQLERAAHDMTYFAPSYLKVQGLLPPPEPKKENNFPTLALSAIEDEEKDPLERQRMKDVGEYRRRRLQRRLQHHQQEEQEEEEYDELSDGEEGEVQRSK